MSSESPELASDAGGSPPPAESPAPRGTSRAETDFHYPRPLLLLTLCFMTGIAADYLLGGIPLRMWHFSVASAILLAGSMAFGLFSARIHALAFSAALFTVFGMWAARASAPEMSFPSGLAAFLERPQVTFIAEVSGPPEHFPDKVRLPLRIEAAISDGKRIPLSAGIVLTIAGKPADLRTSFHLPGDRLLARLTLRPFHNFKNPGGFDYVRYQAAKGFYASAHLKDETFLTRLAPERDLALRSLPYRAWASIDLFRQKALFWLLKSIDRDPAAFYAALLLGYQQMPDRAWQDRIQRTGLNHLLSISGLHLGLVSVLVFCIAKFLLRSFATPILTRISDRQIAAGPALVCALAYAFLAGFGSPPVWRSMMMLAACFAASFRRRSTDPITVLAAAALVILAFDPNTLFQISFQFTFACVLAIIVMYPRFRRFGPAQRVQWRPARKILSLCEDVFWVSVAVSILLTPLTVFYFNGFSLAGFAANIILVPYVGFVILPWGLAGLAVYAVSEPLAFPLIKAGEWLMNGFLGIIRLFDWFSWSYFWTGSISLPWLLAIYGGIAIIFAPLSRKIRLAGTGALALVVIGLGVSGLMAAQDRSGLLRVDVIDVGQGSATLVRFPAGEAMLVDGGGFRDNSFDIGRMVVAPFLWHSGVRRLDHVVLSHDHPDHRNGLRFILSQFAVGRFWTSGISDHDGSAGAENRGLEAVASARDISVRTFPELFNEVRIGDALVRLRHPGRQYLQQAGRSLNDLSLVLEIEFGETTLILPGDIGREVESIISSQFEKERRVLLVSPHHGSGNSNSEELLDALRPQAIVFSCGYANQFGFPAPGALRRCAERNIPMYRTDLDGAVHAVSDGRQWTITTEERR